MKNRWSIIWVALLLSSCSLFGPVKTEPPNTYLLNTVPSVTKHSTRPLSLLVSQPTAYSIYDTTQMAYSTERHGLHYFSKNQWAATPSLMLQPLIVKTLQKTHFFRVIVSAAPGTGEYDLVLNTEITQFEQLFFENASVMKITIRANLVRTSTSKIIASKEFSIMETSPYNSPYGGVLAANEGMSKLLAQLAEWCVKKVAY